MIKELDVITNKFREEYLKSPERIVDLTNENFVKTIEEYIQDFEPDEKMVKRTEKNIIFKWKKIPILTFSDAMGIILNVASEFNERCRILREREIKIDGLTFNIHHIIKEEAGDVYWVRCIIFPFENTYPLNYKGNEISSIEIVCKSSKFEMKIEMKLKEDE